MGAVTLGECDKMGAVKIHAVEMKVVGVFVRVFPRGGECDLPGRGIDVDDFSNMPAASGDAVFDLTGLFVD